MSSEDVSRSGDSPNHEQEHEHEVVADEKRDIKSSGRDSHAPVYNVAILNTDYEGKPTDEELATLRRVPGKVPMIAYLLCCVEFCERASYYGCAQIWTNYVNRPLPPGGNGWGAVAPGSTQTQGGLGLGEEVANAVSQSFSLIAYLLPVFFGYLADAKYGRFPLIFWGVIVCGVGHVLIVVGGAKNLLENGTAKIPFFIGVYILAVGAAMFKSNVTPLLLDQLTTHVPRVKVLSSGERVIEDPEHSTERVMLWFYLLINIGAFISVGTSYSAKYVGWWLAYVIPLILYLPLPILLLWLKKRLIMHKPGGSDLPNVFRVLGYCMANGGVFRIGKKGWWDPAKPSVQAAMGRPVEHRYNDQFVEDTKRAMSATGMFFFFPIQQLNDSGIGSAASFQGTMLYGPGATNDVVSDINPFAIIIGGPILNYGLYPLLRKKNIKYGPIARITTGLAISTLGGIAYTVLQYYAYQTSPCGYYGSSDPTCVDAGLVSPISLWWQSIPYGLGGISELFINVPAYGIAYSRAPVNMRGVLSGVNLLSQALTYIISLAASAVIADPHLVWDFGGPTIAGGIITVFFYFYFRHIDKEEFVLSTTQESEVTGTRDFVQENDMNKSENRPAPIADNEMLGISTKQ